MSKLTAVISSRKSQHILFKNRLSPISKGYVYKSIDMMWLLFFWPCHTVCTQLGILVPQQGIRRPPELPAVEAWRVHHWTVRKVPDMTFLKWQNYKDGEWIGGCQEEGEEGRWAWLPKRSGRGPSDGPFCISTVVVAQATRVVKLHTHTHTHTHTEKHMTLGRAG